MMFWVRHTWSLSTYRLQMRVFKILVVISTAFLLSMSTMNAQKKAVGCSFAFSGLGFSYEHYIESDNFIAIDLNLDTDDYMWNRAPYAGVSADLVWNMVFAEKTTSYGNQLSFYAGPGVMLGYVTDLKDVPGLAFGLKGRVGVECRFKRPIMISASLSPVLGSHLTYNEGDLSMKLYRSGLMHIIVPEIGVKYAF